MHNAPGARRWSAPLRSSGSASFTAAGWTACPTTNPATSWPCRSAARPCSSTRPRTPDSPCGSPQGVSWAGPPQVVESSPERLDLARDAGASPETVRTAYRARANQTAPQRSGRLALSSRSAQRTAVKQRPQQETRRWQVATSEPVVLHHGREERGGRSRRRAAVSFNSLLGSLVRQCASSRERQSGRRLRPRAHRCGAS